MESQKLMEDAKRKYGVIEVESRTFEVVLSREAKIFADGGSRNCIKSDERAHLGLGRTACPRFLLPFRREQFSLRSEQAP
jgi:hypothetical protein